MMLHKGLFFVSCFFSFVCFCRRRRRCCCCCCYRLFVSAISFLLSRLDRSHSLKGNSYRKDCLIHPLHPKSVFGKTFPTLTFTILNNVPAVER
ncbi:hypothetical protein BDB00DRAFT_806829 [Zychaea mexicana]|uniref:uncharacterized protein n=1 Tax=Zychaea mexicana TaxID=64656 RepID=UPI0022FE2F88|nr:uncharacterized protein BDB00DRAFT_806829 [Zychaea mexicana]KAI9497113.1 hypothetical protein BDB00DRAFT_806829 [Zychaea mexicana]